MSHLPPAERSANGSRNRVRRRLALLVTLLVVGAPLAVPQIASAASSTLYGGQVLRPGQYLNSPDGRYELKLENQGGYAGDLYGNLVLYAPGGRATWSTTIWKTNFEQASAPARASVYAIMQTDGNFVLYFDACTCGNRTALWNAGTWGHPGAHLALQSDGNLVIYSPGGQALWNSGTWVPAAAFPAGTWAYRPWGEVQRYGAGRCLDDTNFGIGWGNRMQITVCVGNTNQQWRELVGPPFEPTILLQNLTSGLCLDVNGGSSANFTPAIQYPCAFNDNAEILDIQPAGAQSVYEIRPGTKTCLETPGGQTAIGTLTEFYSCNGTLAQEWTGTQLVGGSSSPPMVAPIDMIPVW